jgi:hypothetical protein
MKRLLSRIVACFVIFPCCFLTSFYVLFLFINFGEVNSYFFLIVSSYDYKICNKFLAMITEGLSKKHAFCLEETASSYGGKLRKYCVSSHGQPTRGVLIA